MKLIPDDRGEESSSLEIDQETENEPCWLALGEQDVYGISTYDGKQYVKERYLTFEEQGGFRCTPEEMREILPYLQRFAYGGKLFKPLIRPIVRWPMKERKWEGIPRKDTSTQVVDRDLFPEWYLVWCWSNLELQAYWRDEWKDSDGHDHSNIWPGDRFSCGTYPQFGIVTRKVLYLYSIEGKPNTHRYTIDGDIGGHWTQPFHEELAKGYFQWIPSIEQLLFLGYTQTAQKLIRFYQGDPDQS